MDLQLREAIETSDSAKQHKCHLEEKSSALKTAIDQVVKSAADSRKNIVSYFEDLKVKLTEACEMKSKQMLDELDAYEQSALQPLQECDELIAEGLIETTKVVDAGEKLLSQEQDTEIDTKDLTKFIDLANTVELYTVPEVPMTNEVDYFTAVLEEDLPEIMLDSVENSGYISKRPPVKFVSFKNCPGGVYISWELSEEYPQDGAPTLYRLQSCVGKVSKSSQQARANFKDEYEGGRCECLVRNLTAKTLYTFRISCCTAEENSPKIWSPWSIYHDKVVSIPAHTWTLTEDVKDSYSLEQKNQTALKTTKNEAAIYSGPSEHFINFPAQFRIDSAGKMRGPSDCIAATFRRESGGNLHLRDATFAMHADGTVWINGKASSTRFPNFYRGMVVSFLVIWDRGHSRKVTMETRLGVKLNVGNSEALFHWQPFKQEKVAGDSRMLNFAAFFKLPGWKVTIL